MWGLPKFDEPFVANPLLDEKLDSWLASSTVLVVEAPSGSGKTSAVASWVGQLCPPRTVIWLSGGLWIRNWQDAMLALGTAVRSTRLLEHDGSDRGDDSPITATLLEIEKPFVVVYDDFDEILGSPTLESIVKADQQLRYGHTVVIRTRPDGREAGTEPAGVTLLDESDLRWSEEMVQSAFERARGSGSSSRFVHELVAATEGRASTIARSIREMSGSLPIKDRRSAAGATELVLDWALGSIRGTLGHDQASHTLALLSLAPEMPRDLVEELEPHDNLDATLEALLAEHLIAENVERRSYSVRQRFRDILVRRAEQLLGAGIREVHARAARFHAGRGVEHLELHHLARSGAVDSAAKRISAALIAHRGSPKAILFRPALASLPDQLYLESPDLLAARVLLSRLPPVDENRRVDLESRLLTLSRHDLREIPLQRRIVVIAATVAVLSSRGRITEALELGQQFVSASVTKGWEVVPNLLDDLATLLLFTAEAAILSGKPRDAIVMIRRAETASPGAGGDFRAYRFQSLLALAFSIAGEVSLAEASIAGARVLEGRLAPLPPAVAYAVPLAEAFVAARNLNSAAMLNAAREFASYRSEAPIWGTLSKLCEAYGQFFAGQPERGLAAIRELTHGVASVGSPLFLETLAGGLAADLTLAVGRPALAIRDVQTVSPIEDHAICLNVPLSSAYLAVGDAQRALEVTDECLALGSSHSLRPLPAVLVRRAVALSMLGRSQAADRVFHEAYLTIRRSPTLAPFLNLARARVDDLIVQLRLSHSEFSTELDELDAQLDSIEHLMLDTFPDVVLTPKEKMVLSRLSSARTIAQIGEELFVSTNTVKSQVSSIYRKLGVSTKREAISLAYSMGLSDSEL